MMTRVRTSEVICWHHLLAAVWRPEHVIEKPWLCPAKVQLPSVVYLIFFFFFNHTCYTLFLDGFFQSATYGLQSSILGPPSIIFHKSPMNLLRVLAVALLNFARDLEVCHIEIFQMDLWPLSNAERDCCTAFLGIPYPTVYYMKLHEIYLHFVSVFKPSFKDLGNVSYSESSEFGELCCSILESVIYEECKSFHLVLKSGFRKWVWYLRLSAVMKITL